MLFRSCTGENRYKIEVDCGKGVYIRTLCHDIGQALGCGGTMCSLRRTMAAGFTLDQAITLEQLQAAEDPERLLTPVDQCFLSHPALTVSPAAERKIRNGAAAACSGVAEGSTLRVYAQDGNFLALCRAEAEQLHTIKSFFEVSDTSSS